MKSRLLDLLKEELADEREVADLAGAPAALRAGDWTAADHIAHYTFWRQALLRHAGELLAGRTPVQPPEDVDAENERHLTRDRGHGAAELVANWSSGRNAILELVATSSEADLERPPEWFAARTVGVAILRNSYTHPRGHLIDFHFQRDRARRAADLADRLANVINEFRERDHRFPAGSLAYRAVALTLRGQPDQAVQVLRQAVELRPAIAPFLQLEATLAGLRGRPDFEELAAASGL